MTASITSSTTSSADRKSTRLNSSHLGISYAVFCLKKKRQIAINGHIKFNLTIPLQQLNGLETLVIIMVANKYAFLQITRRRFLNEWEAFKKVISRRNIRRRITIPLTLFLLKRRTPRSTLFPYTTLFR